jgi:CRP-like cAMP-binding protein
MTEKLTTYLKRNLNLETDLIEKFVSEFSFEKIKSKEYFLRIGSICNKIAFINRGAMYCVYNKDGIDRIDEFSFENEFITDYLSFLTGIPADKDIICLEDCKLLTINKASLEKLYKEDIRFERLGRLMAEGLFINWHLKAKSLFMDDAETRYYQLTSNKPDLVQRVPQYMIASYLNVTPETISRIRKKAAKKRS